MEGTGYAGYGPSGQGQGGRRPERGPAPGGGARPQAAPRAGGGDGRGNGGAPQAARLRALQGRMEAAGIDLLVLTPGTSWFYLAGVHLLGSRLALLLVPRRGEPAWVVPLLEAERVVAAPLVRAAAGAEPAGPAGAPAGPAGAGPGGPAAAGGPAAGGAAGRVCTYADGAEPAPAVARAVALATAGLGGPVRVAAMEERVARLFEWRAASAALPGVTWQPAEPLLVALRARKDAAEVAAIRKAAELVETALGHGMAFIQPGYRESQIAREIERALRELGTRSPFGIHVASGPRSAVPHAETEDRVLQPGDLVWVDVGAEVDGYASDITRTFLLPGGDPVAAAQKAEIYRVCYRAQAAARAAARPGVPADAVDAAARRVIEEAGYGPYFTHRTGHGLGLDVHEAPNIAPGDATILEPGMVFTVEPGIYLPGVGGVRIEDDLLITEEGAVSLTRYRRWLAPEPEPALPPGVAATTEPAGPSPGTAAVSGPTIGSSPPRHGAQPGAAGSRAAGKSGTAAPPRAAGPSRPAGPSGPAAPPGVETLPAPVDGPGAGEPGEGGR